MDHGTYLRLFRKEQSEIEGIALNQVLKDPQIDALVRKRPVPQTKSQLMRVAGVGPVTVEKYGDDILEILQKDDTEELPDIGLMMGDAYAFLSEEQKKVLSLAYEGHNLLMTGQGGVGKSYLIKLLIKVFEQKGLRVQVCALTGAASELLDCPSKTIHAWSGTRIIKGHPEEIIQRTVKNKTAVKAWRNLDVLIVDEVSMLSMKHFDILNTIGQRIRKNKKPFGGIQVIFSGDFYQIPPVADSDPTSGCFCFESQDWVYTILPRNVVELKKVFRQRDKKWLKMLKQIRKGGYSLGTVDALNDRVGLPCDPDNVPTRITPSRKNCRLINQREMAKLDSETKTFLMEVIDNHKEFYPPQMVEGATRALKKGMMSECLPLKVGSEVMCIVNIDLESQRQIVNGSLGVIRDWNDEGYPRVEFRNGRTLDMVPHVINSETVDGLSIKQVPLMPAWAITTHKSQGITLDEAMIDAGSDNFEYGQVYVALSRVKTLEGLYLTSFDRFKIKANPKVTAYYDSLLD
jgi:ATP-dependent DNA helicase PIF1